MAVKSKPQGREKPAAPGSSPAGAGPVSLPGRVALRRTAKGERPHFYDNPAIDQLFAILAALTGEVSVVCDRLDALERSLAAGKVIPADGLESYRPSDAAQEERRIAREELLQRVFAVFEHSGAKRPR